MAHIHRPVKLCQASPRRSRNEIQWDKYCVYSVICLGSSTELLINMRGISKNKSFIEALGAMKDHVYLSILHDASDLDQLHTDDYNLLYHHSCYKSYTSRHN